METSQSTNLGAKRKSDSAANSPRKVDRVHFTRSEGSGEVKETEVSGIGVNSTSGNFTSQSFQDGQSLTYDSGGTFIVPQPPPPESKVEQGSCGSETLFSKVTSFFLFLRSKSANSNSGSVPESMSHNSKEGGENYGEFSKSVQSDSKPTTFSSNIEPEINTLEDSLYHFGLIKDFCGLENSLEEVRRNKISKEEHAHCFKLFDKVMQKRSIDCHPDSVRKNGGSKLEEERAQKIQAALNTTRKVLKLLTAEFIKDVDIHYKYEYFLKMDVSILANETELSHRIGEILFKICELSEIKRMNIVGEIRKFLLESKECIDSYLEGNKKEFKKKCSFALCHLKKCIEGYENVEIECKIVEKECGREDAENMKSSIVKLAKQSLKESTCLKKLESFAKGSLNGNFQIFPSNESMDAYFILPFVYYVNVMLMCNIMLGKKPKCSWFSACSDETIITVEPLAFAHACYLASYFKGDKKYVKEVEDIMKRKCFEISKEDIKKTFKDILTEIVKDLEKRFSIDAYSEGKTNRMLLHERLSNVNERMAKFQEKEKELRQQIRMYEKDTEENWKKYHQIEQRNEDMERRARENFERIKKNDIGKLSVNSTGNLKGPENVLSNENQEKWRKYDHVAKEGSIEFDRKFQEKADENESIRNEVTELMLQSKQTVTEKSNTFEQENWRKRNHVKHNYAETEHKHPKSFEQIEKMGENLSELRLHRNQGATEKEIVDIKNDHIMEAKINELK